MKKIIIDDLLLEQLPNFKVGILRFKAKVSDNNDLNRYINELEKEIENTLTLEDVLRLPLINDARNGYRQLGKDPSRYRLACESLLRRLVKGNGLYRINNIVDCGNVLSIKSNRSVAVLDYDKIKGDIIIKIGGNEPYEGIGRGIINVSNIPVYYDELGPFGSTTSDTLRTSINEDSENILIFIISFSGDDMLDQHLDLAIELYQKYANAMNIESWKI